MNYLLVGLLTTCCSILLTSPKYAENLDCHKIELPRLAVDAEQGSENEEHLLSIIADKTTDQKALVRAIKALGTVKEPAKFWSDIANNSNYREEHRIMSVEQLFRRHVLPGTKLSELALMLNNPTWMEDRDVIKVEFILGYIPVKTTIDNNSTFAIEILPKPGKDNQAVYLRVSGKIDKEAFIKLLRKEAVEQTVRDSIVLEVGF